MRILSVPDPEDHTHIFIYRGPPMPWDVLNHLTKPQLILRVQHYEKILEALSDEP